MTVNWEAVKSQPDKQATTTLTAEKKNGDRLKNAFCTKILCLINYPQISAPSVEFHFYSIWSADNLELKLMDSGKSQV